MSATCLAILFDILHVGHKRHLDIGKSHGDLQHHDASEDGAVFDRFGIFNVMLESGDAIRRKLITPPLNRLSIILNSERCQYRLTPIFWPFLDLDQAGVRGLPAGVSGDVAMGRNQVNAAPSIR